MDESSREIVAEEWHSVAEMAENTRGTGKRTGSSCERKSEKDGERKYGGKRRKEKEMGREGGKGEFTHASSIRHFYVAGEREKERTEFWNFFVAESCTWKSPHAGNLGEGVSPNREGCAHTYRGYRISSRDKDLFPS